MPKVSIQIVTWNSMRYIFDCLESLMRQTFRDFSILVIDNGSDDGTVGFIRANYPTVSVLQNFRNLGFAKANNQGILLSKSEYVLVFTRDLILTEDFLRQLVDFPKKHPGGGSFGEKILKIYREAPESFGEEAALGEIIKSDVIDSAGLEIYKSRQVIDRGEGKKDEGQYDRSEEVFGVSGAGVLYRKAALSDTMIKNESFDQDFFAYKEDIDLAWRLRLYGWESWYAPLAVCYHHRKMARPGGLKKTIKQRRNSSLKLRLLSFRNQRLMLVKNDFGANLFFHLPRFLFREMKIILYSLFFERFQLKGLIQSFQLLPAMLIKRRVIMAHRKVSAKEMRRWFR